MALQRQVQITVPSAQTNDLLERIRQLPGLLSLTVHRAQAIQPPGDTIVVQLKSGALHPLMRLLQDRGIGSSSDTSISTSYVASVVSPSAIEGVGREVSESTWEEIELEVGKESNMTVNGLAVMAIAGTLATLGIATNALHLVVAAMVIAPGFEPILRIGLGLVGRGPGWRRGMTHTGTGYLVLVAAAASTALVLRTAGIHPAGAESTYLPEWSLTPYWSTLTFPSLLASTVGAIGGALLVATDRAVLTSGVMIALALIPSAALMGIALVEADAELFGGSLLRWSVEVGIVFTASLLVFHWKRNTVHKRSMRI